MHVQGPTPKTLLHYITIKYHMIKYKHQES